MEIPGPEVPRRSRRRQGSCSRNSWKTLPDWPGATNPEVQWRAEIKSRLNLDKEAPSQISESLALHSPSLLPSEEAKGR